MKRQAITLIMKTSPYEEALHVPLMEETMRPLKFWAPKRAKVWGIASMELATSAVDEKLSSQTQAYDLLQ